MATRTGATAATAIPRSDNDGSSVLFYAVAGGHLALFHRLVSADGRSRSDVDNRTLLMQAAAHGHTDVAKYLLANASGLGLNVRQTDRYGRNALFYCIESGHLDLLAFLVASGIPLAADNDGCTPLMAAARAGRAETVGYLLGKISNIDAVDNRGETALFHAVHSGSVDVTRRLLTRGASLADNAEGVNVLAQCLADGRQDMVRLMLASEHNLKTAARGRDINGTSSLRHLLEARDDVNLARLARYADFHATDQDGLTILQRACEMTDSVEIVKMLVTDAGFDHTIVDKRGRSSLLIAIDACNHDVVTFLLNVSSDAVVTADNDGRTPLMAACARSDVRIVEALLYASYPRSSATEVDKRHRTPLHYAAANACATLISMLVTHGADVNVADVNGHTPLICACAAGDSPTLAALLRRGADAHAHDKRRRGALHHCVLAPIPSLRCVQMILRYGVDPNLADERGRTPLMLACETCARTRIAVITCLMDGGADPIVQDDEGLDSPDHCPFECAYVKAAMRQRSEIPLSQRKSLLKYRDVLIAALESSAALNDVLQGLVEDKVLTRTLQFDVMTRRPSERAARMLDTLLTRGDTAFRALCQQLLLLRARQREGVCLPHELPYRLLQEAYEREVEVFW